MANTRWGDVLDVLTVSASESVLRQYKVVILLGPVKLDESLKARLKEYVRQGGTVLIAAGVAGPNDSDLCGVEILPELRAGAAWCREGEPYVHEAFRYCPSKSAPGASVRILAQGSNDDPLIVSYQIGQGQVYTCLVPWFEGVLDLAGPASRMFDEVIVSVQPSKIEGLPIYWTSARRQDGLTVALANSSDIEWKGRIQPKLLESPLAECRELLTGESFTSQCEGTLAACDIVVPPFDVRVLSWTYRGKLM